MGLKNKIFIIVLPILCSFCFQTTMNSQINLEFVKHLSVNNLKNEHWIYIEELHSTKDSIAYLKSKFYLQYEQDSLFLESVNNCIPLFLNDSNALNFSCIYFLKDVRKNRDSWFQILDKNRSFFSDSNFFLRTYQFTINPVIIDTSLIPAILQNDFLKYKKAFSKKPVLAATFSALIPGLGELYIGNFKTFGAKLTSHVIFGLQIVESVSILGLISPLPVLNIGFFTAFYGANIIGSYRDTKRKITDTKNQFLINASNYYSLHNHYSLY